MIFEIIKEEVGCVVEEGEGVEIGVGDEMVEGGGDCVEACKVNDQVLLQNHVPLLSFAPTFH